MIRDPRFRISLQVRRLLLLTSLVCERARARARASMRRETRVKADERNHLEEYPACDAASTKYDVARRRRCGAALFPLARHGELFDGDSTLPPCVIHHRGAARFPPSFSLPRWHLDTFSSSRSISTAVADPVCRCPASIRADPSRSTCCVASLRCSCQTLDCASLQVQE